MATKKKIDEKRAAERRKMHAQVVRDATAHDQEIAPIPRVGDKARRDACRLDLRLFCETYLKATFEWAWSADHLAALDRLQSCALTGGQFAFAMPRGSGKSSLCEAGALWAVLYGHRRYVFIVGATDDKAKDSIASIRSELENNDLLALDFPEVCYPIARLEGEPRRANGQTLDGAQTHIKLSDDRLLLPVVPGSASSGSRIRAAGITSSDVRGPKAKTVGGETVRPDLALVDDPQTDVSAGSLSQVRRRLNVINRAVLGMAGPGRKIAAFVPCTVIVPGDLADQLLDRDKNPVWQGQRTRMILAWPPSPLWDKYRELRQEDQRNGDQHGKRAAALYRENREAMDAGGLVSWPERYGRDDENELSAIQHAWNLRIDRGDGAFNSEYQNDPDQPDLGQIEELDPVAITSKYNRVPRGQVPPDVTRLSAFVDVGNKILFWCVCGWAEGFSGHVIDYGTFPPQNRAYFRAEDARPSLPNLYPGLNEEAQIYAGLKEAAAAVCGREYTRQGGGVARVDKCLVDSGKWNKVIAQFCRQSVYSGVLTPSKGWGIGSGRRPMSTWTIEAGERRPGDHWRDRFYGDVGFGRLILFDANYWKSFVARALLTPEMGTGCLQLFGDKPAVHQLFADHLTAEYRSGKFSAVGDQAQQEVWSVRPDRRDNHFFDCLVGCAVAGSVAGVRWSAAGAAGDPVPPRREKVRRKMSEVFAQKNGTGGWL